MTSARGISFDHEPSRLLSRFVVSIVVLASVAPGFTSLPGVVRLAAAGGIAAIGLVGVVRSRRPAIRSLTWEFDGAWTIRQGDGRTFPAELIGSRVAGMTVFLHFRWAGGAGHVALLPDNTPPDTLRMLRAKLARHG